MIALAAITLSLQLQRSSFDLLDGVDIEVAAHNSASSPVTLKFPKPAEYEIDIVRGNDVIWTSLSPPPPGAIFPPHQRNLMPGPTVLVVYIWNTIAADGSTPGPGDYTIRARLLGDGATAQATAPLHFINPVPVSALLKLKAGDELTIAGHLDVNKQVLTDASGSIKLMKRLLAAPPDAVVAVRGYVTTMPDRTQGFYVERWAVMK